MSVDRGREEALETSARVEWQRARRPEEKAARREAILAAAESLLEERGVEGTTLSEIARESGVSKASCYRYFESREAILLEVAVEEVRGWAAEVEERLEPLAGSRDIDGVARAYAVATAARPRFCMLLSALSSVLEHNVSAEAVLRFKRRFNGAALETADGIQRAIPELSDEQMALFMRFLSTAIAGAWPMANPPPVVAGVLRRKEFASVKSELEPSIFDYCRLVLRGLLAEALES